MKNNWKNINKEEKSKEIKKVENIIKKWEERSQEFHQITWKTKIIL